MECFFCINVTCTLLVFRESFHFICSGHKYFFYLGRCEFRICFIHSSHHSCNYGSCHGCSRHTHIGSSKDQRHSGKYCYTLFYHFFGIFGRFPYFFYMVLSESQIFQYLIRHGIKRFIGKSGHPLIVMKSVFHKFTVFLRFRARCKRSYYTFSGSYYIGFYKAIRCGAATGEGC